MKKSIIKTILSAGLLMSVSAHATSKPATAKKKNSCVAALEKKAPEKSLNAPEKEKFLSATVKAVESLPFAIRSEHSEVVVLDKPFSFHQRWEFLPDGSHSSFQRKTTEDGEAQTVSLYVGKKLNAKNNDNQALAGRKNAIIAYQANNEMQKYAGPASSTATHIPSQDPTRYHPSLLKEMLRKYVVATLPSASQLTIDSMVDNLINNKEYLSNMLLKYSEKADSKTVELSNLGLNQYFWFKPTGSEVYRPAKILDIHYVDAKVSFLVEWMIPDQELNKRVRFVTNMTYEESQSILIEDDNLTRAEAAKLFADTLSPNELFATRLAKKMRIHTFGYTTYKRSFSYLNAATGSRRYFDTGMSASDIAAGFDPLNEISGNNPSHLFMAAFIKQAFPKYREYLTGEELEIDMNAEKYEQQGLRLNLIDVFSRIPVSEFFSKLAVRDANIDYFWVITEDGTLKISPYMPKRDGVTPAFHFSRLAHGRRVYAAGGMTLDAYGRVHLKLDSQGYQSVDAEWSTNPQSFQTKTNGDVAAFIMAIFQMQAKQTVLSIDSMATEQYHSANYQHANPSQGDSDFNSSSSEYLFSTLDDILGTGSQKDSERAQALKWNVESNTPPLNKEAWAKEMNLRGALTPIQSQLWAHYVLGTDANMSFSDIKKQYRRYAMKFHPDRNADQGAEAIFKTVQEAYDYIMAK